MPVILPKSNKTHWQVPAELAIDPRASALADRVAAAVLKLHRDAILAGYRAGDGAPQPPMDPNNGSGRKARKGRRPSARGNTGKPRGFARTLRRGKAKKAPGDTHSTVTIEAPRGNPKWLAAESRRGVQYLFTDGAVAEAIEAATVEWLHELVHPKQRKR